MLKLLIATYPDAIHVKTSPVAGGARPKDWAKTAAARALLEAAETPEGLARIKAEAQQPTPQVGELRTALEEAAGGAEASTSARRKMAAKSRATAAATSTGGADDSRPGWNVAGSFGDGAGAPAGMTSPDGPPPAVAHVAAGVATVDISDAAPVVTAEERAKTLAEERVKEAAERAARKTSILEQLHPGLTSGATATAPAALDAQTRETVTTIAERSGLDAAAIAAMLSLDVEAVRAVLAPNTTQPYAPLWAPMPRK